MRGLKHEMYFFCSVRYFCYDRNMLRSKEPLVFKSGYDASFKKKVNRVLFLDVSNVRNVLAQGVKNSKKKVCF